MCEIWKPVIGYEGHYEISNYGIVKSISRIIVDKNGRISKKNELILKPGINRDGYLQVGLSINNKLFSHYVHRLVAEAFIENPFNKTTVNHKDGNKLNNHISNLEWATKSEQAIHSLDMGLRNMPESWNGKFGGDHGASKYVLQFDLKGNYITEYKSIIEAADIIGIHSSGITKVCKGKGKSAGGYFWKHKSILL